MKNNSSPGLSVLWLIVLATTLGVYLPTMVSFIYGSEPVKASDWIGFSGSVLTAGVTCAAIYYAWRGLTHQSRLDLISREEDRIERELPGLQDAVMLTSVLHRSLIDVPTKAEFPRLVYHVFELEGLRSPIGDDAHAEIARRLPATDIRTRREIRNALSLIIFRTEIARRSIENGGCPENEINGVMMAVGMLIGMEDKYKKRIESMEMRASKIRVDIEDAIK